MSKRAKKKKRAAAEHGGSRDRSPAPAPHPPDVSAPSPPGDRGVLGLCVGGGTRQGELDVGGARDRFLGCSNTRTQLVTWRRVRFPSLPTHTHTTRHSDTSRVVLRVLTARSVQRVLEQVRERMVGGEEA